MRLYRTAGAKRNGASWWKGLLLCHVIRETNAFALTAIRTGETVRVRFGRMNAYNTVEAKEND